MLKKILQKIGLTEGEIQVYTALLELGLTSTGAITKKANIASSKVYEVLQRLQNKGLASYIIKNGTRYYDATPAKRLIDFLQEKKDSLTESQQEIKKIIPQLELKRKKARENNQTIIYTGVQGPKIVLNEILEAGIKGIDNCGFGTDEDPYIKFIPTALHKFIKDSRKYKFKTRLIFAKGFKSPNINAKIKHLPEEYLMPVRIMIYGSKVAIVDFTKPITTIIIEKKEIALAYKKHFELLWKIAKN